MATKSLKQLKNLSNDELVVKIRDLEHTIFQTRIKKVTGQLENVSSLKVMRKDLARAKTLQTQKQK